jgi:hypothetical protein
MQERQFGVAYSSVCLELRIVSIACMYNVDILLGPASTHWVY